MSSFFLLLFFGLDQCARLNGLDRERRKLEKRGKDDLFGLDKFAMVWLDISHDTAIFTRFDP